jgi:hypothetical protein
MTRSVYVDAEFFEAHSRLDRSVEGLAGAAELANTAGAAVLLLRLVRSNAICDWPRPTPNHPRLPPHR